MTTDELHKRVEDIEENIVVIIKAFPHIDSEADFDGHRKAHEAMIKAAQAQERFWNEMKLDIAKKGTVGLLVIIIGLVMTGLATKLGIWAVVK